MVKKSETHSRAFTGAGPTRAVLVLVHQRDGAAAEQGRRDAPREPNHPATSDRRARGTAGVKLGSLRAVDFFLENAHKGYLNAILDKVSKNVRKDND